MGWHISGYDVASCNQVSHTCILFPFTMEKQLHGTRQTFSSLGTTILVNTAKWIFLPPSRHLESYSVVFTVPRCFFKRHPIHGGLPCHFRLRSILKTLSKEIFFLACLTNHYTQLGYKEVSVATAGIQNIILGQGLHDQAPNL